MSGTIEAIHLAGENGAPLYGVQHATLIADSGILGDRHDDDITLIEIEATEAAGLAPGESRRNIAVRGLALNALVGKRFRVGSALCEGTELAHPCAYLEGLLERPGLTRQLAGKGGIRARVLEEGEIHVGDTVTPL